MGIDVTQVNLLTGSFRGAEKSCRAFIPLSVFARLDDGGGLHRRTRTRSSCFSPRMPGMTMPWILRRKIYRAAIVFGDRGLCGLSPQSIDLGWSEEPTFEPSPAHTGGSGHHEHVQHGPLHTHLAAHATWRVSLGGDALASAEALAASAVGAVASRTRGDEKGAVLVRPPAGRGGEAPREETQREFVKRVSKLGRRRRGKEVLKAIQAARARGSLRFTLVMCNACITALGRCGLWGRALDLLAEMRERAAEWRARIAVNGDQDGVEHPVLPDVFSYSAAITACAIAGRRRQALELLKEMRDEGVPPNVVSYNAAAHACVRKSRERSGRAGRLRSDGASREGAGVECCRQEEGWSLVLQLMDEMRHHGLSPDPFTYSTAITACGDAGEWKRAIALLDEMESEAEDLQPDLVSVNAAIAACARAGQSARALELLERMIAEKHKSLGEAGRPAESDSGQATRAAPGVSRRKKIRRRRRSWPLPDAVSFNSAMEACATPGAWQIGADLFKRMQDEGVRPDVRSYAAALSCLRAGKQWTRALGLLEEMSAKDEDCLSPDLGCFGTVISALGEAGQWERALALLRRLEMNRTVTTTASAADKTNLGGENGDSSPSEVAVSDNMVASSSATMGPNLVCYNAVLAACAKAGAWEPALRLLMEMEDRGVFDVLSFNSAIHACRRRAQWRKAVELLGRMCNGDAALGSGRSWASSSHGMTGKGPRRRRKVPSPDAYSFTSAIAACAAAGKEDLALSLVRGMPSVGVSQTVAAFNAAIGSIGRGSSNRDRAWTRPEQERKECDACSDESHALRGSSYMGDSSGWACERARDVLDEMRTAGLAPDVQSYNQVLAVCQRVLAWRCALDLLEEMKYGIAGDSAAEIEAPRPDLVSYNTAMGACGRAGRWQESLSLLDEMHAYGLVPGAVSYNTASAACANVEQWQEALDVLELGRRSNVLPAHAKDPSAEDHDAEHAAERGGSVRHDSGAEEGFHSFVEAMARRQRAAVPGELSGPRIA